MSADTAAKRYSGINLASPWRGVNVVPDATLPQGERQAAMYMYSGILAGQAAVEVPVSETIGLAVTHHPVDFVIESPCWLPVGIPNAKPISRKEVDQNDGSEINELVKMYMAWKKAA